MNARPKTPTRRGAALGAVAAAALLALGAWRPAAAQDGWPDRAVTLVVPYSAGGPTDVVARMLAVPMGRSLGQTVVVENTVGAGGTIAAARVAKAAPNGYTILIHHMGMATAPALYKKLSYDPLKDFEYVGQVLDVPMTLLARKDFPANNFPELLNYVKANGDKVTLAHAGLGAVSQLCGMLFAHQVGIKPTQVPYRGAGPAMADLMGGQVDLLCDQTTQTVPVIKDRRARVYGVTTAQRLASMPDLPTLDEQGLKGFEVKVWHGVYAPKGTPQPVVDKLVAALRAGLQDPTVRQRLADLSSEVVPMDKVSPAALRSHLEAEVVKWGKVIRESGVQATDGS